jgi:DNA-binding beta-propeller fold protein YncE
MWDRPSSDMSIAPSPDGAYLFVVDAGRGEIAVMDTESLRVRSGPVDLRVDDLRRTSAQVSADGETLYVATSAERSTITAIDVRTFDVLDRWDVDGDVTGLGLSADGERLYAATSDDGLAMFDLATGEALDGVTVRTPEPVTRVIPLGA